MVSISLLEAAQKVYATIAVANHQLVIIHEDYSVCEWPIAVWQKNVGFQKFVRFDHWTTAVFWRPGRWRTNSVRLTFPPSAHRAHVTHADRQNPRASNNFFCPVFRLTLHLAQCVFIPWRKSLRASSRMKLCCSIPTARNADRITACISRPYIPCEQPTSYYFQQQFLSYCAPHSLSSSMYLHSTTITRTRSTKSAC